MLHINYDSTARMTQNKKRKLHLPFSPSILPATKPNEITTINSRIKTHMIEHL